MEHTLIYPDTKLKFIKREIGYGVVATQFVQKGTITWVMDDLDRRFTLDEIMLMKNQYGDILEKYAYRDACGDYVLCWDHARFGNHRFFPNCITTAYNFELAVRNIEAGEELLNDYGTLNVAEPFYCLPAVNHPLKRYVPAEIYRTATAVAGGEKKMDSIRSCYYSDTLLFEMK